MSLISVVIASQGHLEKLKRTFDSLGFLNSSDLEVFVLSNCEFDWNHEKVDFKKIIGEKVSFGHFRNILFPQINGEWVLFLTEGVSLHHRYMDYLSDIFSNPKVECFGGPLLASKNQKILSYSLHIACSSPLCTGTSFARHRGLGNKMVSAGDEKLSIDHLWVKKSLLSDHFFNDQSDLSEEIVGIQNLVRDGHGVFFHPKLIAWSNIESSLKEFFHRGYLRSSISRMKITPGSEIYWVPSIFLLFHLTFFLDKNFFFQVLFLYLSIIGFISFGLAVKSKNILIAPLVMFYHYLIVIFYGSGFLKEKILNKFNKD